MKSDTSKHRNKALTALATAYYKPEPRPELISCTVRLKKQTHEELNRAIGKLRAKGSKITFQSVLASAAEAFVQENK